MLQKGFLKPQESKEDSRALKMRRAFLIGGIGGVLFSFIALMMSNLHRFWIFVMIVGFGLIFISMWMNFLVQYKNKKTGV